MRDLIRDSLRTLPRDGVMLFLSQSLKIAYDLVLYREFAAVRPPEETNL